MPAYLSPEARLKLCKLIANQIKQGDLKLYATLGRVGLKGPAFYAYVEGRSVPSEEVVPKIVSLALALDRDEAVKIVREDLKGLTEFVDQILGFASASISSVDQILEGLLGPKKRRTRTEK
ncbi:MAG: hypothetical protein QMD00_05900 [Hadesarchaea archaeon]|nr:hypothetical protein [Hadesarchaea archaeon]